MTELWTGKTFWQSGAVRLDDQPQHPKKSKKNDKRALDEMFEKSRRYRSSEEYFKLMQFIAKFREHAPFNAKLLCTQNPDAHYVMTASEWEREFGCRPKRAARPLVILWPFAPVHFVYDVMDIEPIVEGKPSPVPEQLRQPFKTEGKLSSDVLEITIENLRRHGIDVKLGIKRTKQAGAAMRVTREVLEKYRDLRPMPNADFLILLNESHSCEEKYGTLAHEVAHIFCGHCGTTRWSWWKDKSQRTLTEEAVDFQHEVEEYEAESVAFLVCQRQGLLLTSEQYLFHCRKNPQSELPPIGLHAVLQSVEDIEKLGERVLEKPLHRFRA